MKYFRVEVTDPQCHHTYCDCNVRLFGCHLSNSGFSVGFPVCSSGLALACSLSTFALQYQNSNGALRPVSAELLEHQLSTLSLGSSSGLGHEWLFRPRQTRMRLRSNVAPLKTIVAAYVANQGKDFFKPYWDDWRRRRKSVQLGAQTLAVTVASRARAASLINQYMRFRGIDAYKMSSLTVSVPLEQLFVPTSVFDFCNDLFPVRIVPVHFHLWFKLDAGNPYFRCHVSQLLKWDPVDTSAVMTPMDSVTRPFFKLSFAPCTQGLYDCPVDVNCFRMYNYDNKVAMSYGRVSILLMKYCDQAPFGTVRITMTFAIA
jgi:hypothetical protein